MSSPIKPKCEVNLVDLGFMDARAKVIDVAAFLDRIDRHGQAGDFRVRALREAIRELTSGEVGRAARVLASLSDPTDEPVERAPMQGALGAWDGAGAKGGAA